MSDEFAVMLAVERDRMEWQLPLGERLERKRARRRCPVCRGRVDAHGRSPNRARYCSDACKMRAYRSRVTTVSTLRKQP